jgi:hypothetical protein
MGGGERGRGRTPRTEVPGGGGVGPNDCRVSRGVPAGKAIDRGRVAARSERTVMVGGEHCILALQENR